MAQDDEQAEALGIPWETVQAEFGFDDVGRRALHGGARDELFADYPHLREEDIEQARQFIEDEERALRRRDRRPPFDLARFQPRKKPVVISEFDAWVGANNIADHFEFGKGWWDYVELIRTFAARLDSEDVRVVGHYIVETPPPTELLPMPAVAIVTPAATFAFRYDFGTWSLKQPVALSEWVLSVDRERPIAAPRSGCSTRHAISAPKVLTVCPPTTFSVRTARTRPSSRASSRTNGPWPCSSGSSRGVRHRRRDRVSHDGASSQVVAWQRPRQAHGSPSPARDTRSRTGTASSRIAEHLAAPVNPIPYFAPSARSSSIQCGPRS